ncbi:DUF2339 domain-containing protein [Desulfitobacterium sp. AusDCA]|uniref:DUF2339 domain-containing protein n=1 Tax=Desulfitobacterium sp. AusDCA TaxID=3240383 RepID=UPI003DA6CE3C
MAMTDKLKDIAARQKEISLELESEWQNISNNDLTKENDALKNELEKAKSDLANAEKNLKVISDEKNQLKNALYEQIYNEKISILKMSSTKTEIYFKSNIENEVNRLTAFENRVKSRIDELAAALKLNNIDINEDIYKRLDELTLLTNQKITQARADIAKTTGVYSENEAAEFEKLRNEEISEGQIKELYRKNNIETFVGLNIINKLGIFLVVIGVIAASQFVYFKLTDTLKGIMMFSLGILMLAGGEFLNRKKPNIFSLGITAGGIAVLFAAISISYFRLYILTMYPALLICVLITAAAFLLSQWYNSQTIAAFAFIGGYLPIFSISGNLILMNCAMVYFVLLNLMALLISFKNKWIISTYIGLFFNIFGTLYLLFSITEMLSSADFGFNHIAVILYILFAFIIYTLVPVLGNYFNKLKFQKADIILLGINTFISAIILYGVFYTFNLDDFTGLLAIAFAIAYLFFGRFIEAKFKNEKNAQALFYLTSLAFVILVIPFQFGKTWLALGWLVEGVALTTYGILRNEENLQKGGYVIDLLCVFSFIFFDLFIGLDDLFAYKYLALTLGSLIILCAYIYRRILNSKTQKVYKYVTVVNLWIYLLYISFEVYKLIQPKLLTSFYSAEYLTQSLAVIFTFLIAYVAPRIRVLTDSYMKIISLSLYGMGILCLFAMNMFESVFYLYPRGLFAQEIPLSVQVIGSFIIVIMGLLSLFALRELIKCIVMDKKIGIEWYPLTISAYFVLILTQNLITQYSVAFSSVAISIIYVLTALSWIIFGFIKRYILIRRFGLGISLAAVAKLFIVDLAFLTQGYRIFSYFILGITLIAISFVYQYFDKRLEPKGALND